MWWVWVLLYYWCIIVDYYIMYFLYSHL
jgi:hypothetical protein